MNPTGAAGATVAAAGVRSRQPTLASIPAIIRIADLPEYRTAPLARELTRAKLVIGHHRTVSGRRYSQ
jgi:hypothetical protein